MDKIQKVARSLVNNTFRLKKDELLVITSDFKSNHDINEAIAKEAYKVGGKVIIFKTAPAEGHGKAADEVIPHDSFVNMMLNADCWLDTGSMGWLYSTAFEDALTTNKKIRYLLVSNMGIDKLSEMFIENYSPALEKFCEVMKEMIIGAKKITISNPYGTNVEFGIDLNFVLVSDIGVAATPGFYTIPALFNIIPKFDSTNGKIAFSSVFADPCGVLDEPLTVEIKNGMITDVSSNNENDAIALKKWLEKWDDENSYRVAHVNFGLLAKVKELTGNGILDERMWGGINWGFGNISAIDAPPDGIDCKSHFDCILVKPSVWIDDIKIMDNGEFIYGELKLYADEILKGA